MRWLALAAVVACSREDTTPPPAPKPQLIVRDAALDAAVDAPADAAVTATLAECRGAFAAPPDATRCRTRQDCVSPAECEATGPFGRLVRSTGGCGMVRHAPPDQCKDDRGCRGGQICEDVNLGCWDHLARRCVPRCRNCTADERCGRDGRCEPKPPPACKTRANCAPNLDCIDHGCLERACKTDGDCDCGACVNEACAPQLGVCIRRISPV